MIAALAMTGCSSGHIQNASVDFDPVKPSDPPKPVKGNTLAVMTTISPVSNGQYQAKHEQTEGVKTDIQLDGNGELKSVTVTTSDATHRFAEDCWGNELFGECYDTNGGWARVTNYFDTYEHLKTVEWERQENPGSTSAQVLYGEGIIGTKTPLDEMPKDIKADYVGNVIMRASPDSGQVSGNDVRQGMGNAHFQADFRTGSFSGTFWNFSDRETGDALKGQVAIDGRIRDNGFSVETVKGTFADMSISSGSGKGYFYGPKAAELGGTATFKGTCNNGQNCSGTAMFVGKKQ